MLCLICSQVRSKIFQRVDFLLKKLGFYQEFDHWKGSKTLALCLRNSLPGESASFMEGLQGRQLNTVKEKDFQRSISGIEPAYPKYELGERDRDKDPMDVPLPSLSMWYLSLCSVKTFSQCRKVEQLQGLRQRVQLLTQVEIKELHLNLRNFPIWIWRAWSQRKKPLRWLIEFPSRGESYQKASQWANDD